MMNSVNDTLLSDGSHQVMNQGRVESLVQVGCEAVHLPVIRPVQHIVPSPGRIRGYPKLFNVGDDLALPITEGGE